MLDIKNLEIRHWIEDQKDIPLYFNYFHALAYVLAKYELNHIIDFSNLLFDITDEKYDELKDLVGKESFEWLDKIGGAASADESLEIFISIREAYRKNPKVKKVRGTADCFKYEK